MAARNTHQLLGMQVLGGGAVDKFTDIAALGISNGLKLEDYNDIDFAYAPPFSTAINPFVSACYVLENKISIAWILLISLPENHISHAIISNTVLIKIHKAAIQHYLTV